MNIIVLLSFDRLAVSSSQLLSEMISQVVGELEGQCNCCVCVHDQLCIVCVYVCVCVFVSVWGMYFVFFFVTSIHMYCYTAFMN